MSMKYSEPGAQVSKNDKKGRLHFAETHSDTKQADKRRCDVNHIIANARQNGGLVHHVNSRVGRYGDFTHVRDFRASMDSLVKAKEAFEALPTSLRTRFHNDPQEFMEFVRDPNNIEEGIKLGVYAKREEEPLDVPLPLPEPVKAKKKDIDDAATS